MTPEEYGAQPLTFAETKDLFAHNPPNVPIVEDRIAYDPKYY